MKIFLLLLLAAVQPSEAGSATWNLNPISADWNTAANWTPATVPNGPDDTATFDVSNRTAVSVSKDIEVNGIVYNPGASAFTTTLRGTFTSFTELTLSGTGITNNSGLVQSIIATTGTTATLDSGMFFLNSATAGGSANFTVEGGSYSDSSGAYIIFQDQSSAGDALFTINGGGVGTAGGGDVIVEDNSTAANGTFICNGGAGYGGGVNINYPASAGDGTFVANNGGGLSVSGSIANATFTLNTALGYFTAGGLLATPSLPPMVVAFRSSGAGVLTQATVPLLPTAALMEVMGESFTLSGLQLPAVRAWRFTAMGAVTSAITTLRGSHLAHSKETA